MPRAPTWISLKTWEKMGLIIEAIIIASIQMSFHGISVSLAHLPYGFFIILLNGVFSPTV